jgi:hypothetical protein
LAASESAVIATAGQKSGASGAAVTLLSLVANAASPSRPERLLWTPVLALMAAAALGVGLL